MTITLPFWMLLIILVAVGCDMLFRLWILFLACMNLGAVKRSGVLATLDPFIQKAAQAVWVLGAFVNLLARHTVACLIFRVGWKRGEYGISALVDRILDETWEDPDDWHDKRKARALWWRQNVLGPYDPSGDHNGPGTTP